MSSLANCPRICCRYSRARWQTGKTCLDRTPSRKNDLKMLEQPHELLGTHRQELNQIQARLTIQELETEAATGPGHGLRQDGRTPASRSSSSSAGVQQATAFRRTRSCRRACWRFFACPHTPTPPSAPDRFSGAVAQGCHRAGTAGEGNRTTER